MTRIWKKWILLMLGTMLLFCGIIAGVNYMVDPLWCFDHKVPIGRYQPMFDERQQKTDWLTFHDVSCDTVILGNSRSTYMNPEKLPGTTFNYAVSAMSPYEFMGYLNYVAEKNSEPIKVVVLGLNFGSTNASSKSSFEKPEWYINRANSIGFRYKSLLNITLFKHSIKAILKDIEGCCHNAYIRQGRKIISKQMELPIEQDVLKSAIADNVFIYKTRVYGGDYRYRNNRTVYTSMRERFPDAKFLVYTTPVSRHLLKVLVEQGKIKDYERWLTDLIGAFGEVWNFMYFNDITMNDNNYKDAHHYSPEIANVIGKKIYDLPTERKYKSFGIRMTRSSLNDDLLYLRNNMISGCECQKDIR